jgi:2-polyprenyl-3-methyl-5-hydroxy-6-metoxy-1,4-benzoquinol methylase
MENEYCMPVEYKTNPVRYFDDTPFKDEYQDDIYKMARDIYDPKWGNGTVLDLGCGSGFKLIKHFDGIHTIGCDLPPTISKVRSMYAEKTNKQWEVISSTIYDGVSLVISSDVLEHLEDPISYLAYINRHDFSDLILSTPNRKFYMDIKKTRDTMGPPWNPHHIREWLPDELVKFLSTVFDVTEVIQEYPTIVCRCRRKAS